jgi:hypothetical protein
MIRPSRTCPCFERRVSSRSNTISLTLLSDSLMTKVIKQDAAALIAAGFWVRVVRVVAASYLTACEGALRSSKMHRMYLDWNRYNERVEHPTEKYSPCALSRFCSPI